MSIYYYLVVNQLAELAWIPMDTIKQLHNLIANHHHQKIATLALMPVKFIATDHLHDYTDFSVKPIH